MAFPGGTIMEDSIVITPYDEAWPFEFKTIGQKIRDVLQGGAIRIDHVGSTSVLGLDAKPVIDIQISVKHLEPLHTYKHKLESIGFIHRANNPDKTKRYFRETPGTKRTHIHVREQGSWSQQMALLFRDYLRTHPEACHIYAKDKRRLMELYKDERLKYVEGKTPVIWNILQKAHSWSEQIGWRPADSDV
jgi:GrpB-like predicted nucleotidyltransferase (UPF0157 family)